MYGLAYEQATTASKDRHLSLAALQSWGSPLTAPEVTPTTSEGYIYRCGAASRIISNIMEDSFECETSAKEGGPDFRRNKLEKASHVRPSSDRELNTRSAGRHHEEHCSPDPSIPILW
ncbi:uncharacterized protein PAC_05775 [Phialocephala subalpina]|uniref:Uncharacterized protein n=1 Tax=Phialocephala subalpina TaxID=576137 RepID=A0A1L7WSZ5_9HELO|nr:uncharacterized protein PAC_05775 [Phialocephala subalpina]